MKIIHKRIKIIFFKMSAFRCYIIEMYKWTEEIVEYLMRKT